MSSTRPQLPQIGELVVASVKRIEGYGAYVSLDEYDGREAFMHISEISSTWVRNIRNHVREGQKVVLQVLRVDPARSQIDVSLRRVSKDEQRKKIEEFKKSRKAETLIKGAAEQLKMSEADLYESVVPKLEETYGSLYAGLEEAAKKDASVLINVGLPENVAEVIAKIAQDKIPVRGVTVQGSFEITSMEPRGVEAIQKVLIEAKEVGEASEADVALYTLGAPKYRVEVTSSDYKRAEAALEKIVGTITSAWSKHDGRFAFKRE